MTKEEIFKKAIKKAVKNGYTAYSKNLEQVKDKEGFLNDIVKSVLREKSVYEIIFSHDFAKAFFGKEIKCNTCDLEQKEHKITDAGHFYECSNCGILVEGAYCDKSWKNHLSFMVLEKDPLEYLEKFL